MIVLLLGPQGSGKGTQGKLLAEKLNLSYLSTGDVFRSMISKRPDIAEVMKSGKLLSDEVVLGVFNDYIKENPSENLIIDGVPRRLSQYEALKKVLGAIDLAILLKISREETVRRLSARRQDPVTGKIYNLITNPPGNEVNVEMLVHRDDDKPEAINVRLDEYEKDTIPMLDKMKSDGILVELDGERTIEEIHKDIISIVGDRLHAKD